MENNTNTEPEPESNIPPPDGARIRTFPGHPYAAELIVTYEGREYLRVLGPEADTRWFLQPLGQPVTDEDQHAILNDVAHLEEVAVEE